MWQKFFIPFLLLFCLVGAIEAQIPGVTVRGQVVRNQFPVAGVAITLFSNAYGRSAVTYSGGDGMYYFYNVPQGPYVVEIWFSGQPRPVGNVLVNPPYTDIQRVFLP
jgi:carboxypeptidase family protein